MTKNNVQEGTTSSGNNEDAPKGWWKDLPQDQQEVIAKNRLGSNATPKTLEMLEELGLD